METIKRILDYGYYCDLVETNNGNLRIDIDPEQRNKVLKLGEQYHDGTEDECTANENDVFPEMLSQFDYLEYIPDLGNDTRFGALTSSCGLYHSESKRLWWYPDSAIHNIFQKLVENKEVTFTLAN